MVTTYQPMLHTTAERELQSLESDDRDTLTEVLKDVATCESPTQHKKTKSLEGQDGLFRVRVRDMRAIVTLEKPHLKILKIGYRRKVYDSVDSIHERLA